MGREETDDQFKDLKQHSIPNHHIEEINIAEAIMTRISPLQSRGPKWIYRPAGRFSVYATVITILLLTSASVYAASEYIQIRNRAGDVKIQSVILEQETKLIPYERKDEASKPTYRDRVLEVVKPGQLLAYYVRDDLPSPKIQYLHNTNIFSSYNDFKELLLRTSAPVIKEPTNLPAGFKFKYGAVMPLLPNEHDDRTSAEHTRLLELFQQRAAADPDQDLFIEEVNWSDANSSSLEYENDELVNIRIMAWKSLIGAEVSFSAEYAQEILDINGTETIFASAIIHGFKKYEAIWYDEALDTHNNVSASGNVELTEEQFKLIVKGLIE